MNMSIPRVFVGLTLGLCVSAPLASATPVLPGLEGPPQAPVRATVVTPEGALTDDSNSVVVKLELPHGCFTLYFHRAPCMSK